MKFKRLGEVFGLNSNYVNTKLTISFVDAI